MTVFRLNGVEVESTTDASSLLDVLREEFGCTSVKDGCSPQGQCGCCTVLVDGSARVACVTPVRRVAGRDVVTVEGLPAEVRERWTSAFVDAGASQCGFCTPGIVLRLVALGGRRDGLGEDAVRTALLAHLCRCTGWQTVVAAACRALGVPVGAAEPEAGAPSPGPRDPLLVAWRAELEGSAPQVGGPDAVLGRGGFADDTAPPDALVAAPAGDDGDYVLAARLSEVRRLSGKVQGRNSTVPLTHPLPVPEGEWALTLRTTWVEPAYLEPDASWCRPGAVPWSPRANGGAFGGKERSPVPDVARRLADEHDRPVRVCWPREHVVRHGPKRPPVAMAVRADGSGVLRLARTAGSGDLSAVVAGVAGAAHRLAVDVVPVAGPPVSADLRGAGWAEAAVLQAGWRAWRDGVVGPGAEAEVESPGGGRARAVVDADGRVRVEVWAGAVLDEVVLRSYCIGAVHQALGWVRSEGVSVDGDGSVLDLTIRSFGILSARDMPPVAVTVHDGDGWPSNGSDAVFAATAAAAWIADGLPPEWPTRCGQGDRPPGPRSVPGGRDLAAGDSVAR